MVDVGEKGDASGVEGFNQLFVVFEKFLGSVYWIFLIQISNQLAHIKRIFLIHFPNNHFSLQMIGFYEKFRNLDVNLATIFRAFFGAFLSEKFEKMRL